MAKRRKFQVYLAGPISGCNDAQKHEWRDEIKRKYSAHFNFTDPTSDTWDENATPYDIVRADLDAIENADGMLLNMWRESIGSAIGMVHAHRTGSPVVVANPNRISNQMLNFYADALTDHPLKAASALHSLLRAESEWHVVKSGERSDEPFDRRKLVSAIGAACRSAGRNDIVVSREALPAIIEHLKKSRRKIQDRVPSKEINRAVSTTLAELEADRTRSATFEGVLRQWQLKSKKKLPAGGTVEMHDQPGSWETGVEVSGTKAHSSIWGKTIRSVSDIPSVEARRTLDLIARTPGITRIRLGPFSRASRRRSTSAFLKTSSTPYVLEGGLYDDGEKGTLQTFQVRVQNNEEKDEILRYIVVNLRTAGYLSE